MPEMITRKPDEFDCQRCGKQDHEMTREDDKSMALHDECNDCFNGLVFRRDSNTYCNAGMTGIRPDGTCGYCEKRHADWRTDG